MAMVEVEIASLLLATTKRARNDVGRVCSLTLAWHEWKNAIV